MPILNLDADTLLQGITRKVKQKKIPPVRNMSIESLESNLSKVSKFSKFTITENNPDTIIDGDGQSDEGADADFKSSPSNVRFASMKK